MTDPRLEMRKAIDAQTVVLAGVRRCSKAEAARSVAETFAANLSLSRGTTMEHYWREMSALADELAR